MTTMTMTSSTTVPVIITATTVYHNINSKRSKMMLLLIKQLLFLLLCITFLLLDGCNSFATPKIVVRRGGGNHRRLLVVKSPTTTTTTTTLKLAFSGSSNSNIQYDNNNNNNDNDDDDESPPPVPGIVLLMDWECILQNQKSFIESYRIAIGINAAIKVWPQLQSLVDNYYYGGTTDDSDSDDDSNLTWLRNKLHALSHVLIGNNKNISATCDYALATRMILEEQELDQGISTGKNGKYAKQFHPRRTTTTRRQDGGDDDSDSNDSDDNDDEEVEEPKIIRTTTTTTSSSSSSSGGGGSSGSSSSRRRPLTVGEIAVNWNEYLRETLQMKYSIDDRKDPIPILQSTIEELQQQQYGNDGTDDDEVCIDPKAMTLLDNSIYPNNIIYFMTSCNSDMDILQSLLLEKKNDEYSKSSIRNNHQKKVKVNLLDSSSTINIQDILENDLDRHLPDGSHIIVIESSWGRLQKNFIPLFGDSIPRRIQKLPSSSDYYDYYYENESSSSMSSSSMSIGSCIIPKRKLSLGLCDWTKSTSHPTHKMEATMNPWTQILDWDDIINNIIIPQPPPFQ